MVVDRAEAVARLQRRILLHEAAHAVTCWLMGGQVGCVSGLGFTQTYSPEPAMRAIHALAGPAMDSHVLDWLTEAHLELPEVRAANERVRDIGEAVEAVLGNGGTPETDTDSARRHLARLQGDPERLCARAWDIADEMVQGSDTRTVIDRVADALEAAGDLDARAFEMVVEPFAVLRVAVMFLAPWAELGSPSEPSGPRR